MMMTSNFFKLHYNAAYGFSHLPVGPEVAWAHAEERIRYVLRTIYRGLYRADRWSRCGSLPAARSAAVDRRRSDRDDRTRNFDRSHNHQAERLVSVAIARTQQ